MYHFEEKQGLKEIHVLRVSIIQPQLSINHICVRVHFLSSKYFGNLIKLNVLRNQFIVCMEV